MSRWDTWPISLVFVKAHNNANVLCQHIPGLVLVNTRKHIEEEQKLKQSTSKGGIRSTFVKSVETLHKKSKMETCNKYQAFEASI